MKDNNLVTAREPLNWSLTELSSHLQKRKISPVEVVNMLLERIETVNPIINAFITVLAEQAKRDALQAEKDIMSGAIKGPLHGIPVGLKDLIYTKGIRTTMGSQIYRDYIPNEDATVVRRLKDAGAIIIGKLNTHQFAYGPTGDRSYFGAVRNPHDLSRISGGSSSGSAAAVAAHLCYGALGTDTGGSIRIPSSCCGVVGMKPTFGRVSKAGVYPLSWSLDHVGPMTRTIEDNAFVLAAISGYDEADPYSLPLEAEDFTRYLGQGLKGRTIGMPNDFYFEHIDEEVSNKIEQAFKFLEQQGATLRPIDLPHIDEALAAQRVIIGAEAYTVHKEHIKEMPELIEEEVRERILASSQISMVEFIQAQQMKQKALASYNQAFKSVDVIMAPTIPILPPELDQREVQIGGYRETVRSALTRLTGPTDLTGLPSLSVPVGFSREGLPIGLQVIGKAFQEASVFRFGYALKSCLNL